MSQICSVCLLPAVFDGIKWIHRGGRYWQRCMCGWAGSSAEPLHTCPSGHAITDTHAADPLFPIQELVP